MNRSIMGDGGLKKRCWISRLMPKISLLSVLVLAMTAAAPAQAISPDTGPGPVRLARVSYVTGTVSYRISEQAEWSSAVRNLPLRQGAEVTASGNGRTEIQFDDGSRLRLGDGAIATLTIMYSDAKGEYTQISLRTGEASLRIEKAVSVYEVDTPTASVDVSGPARVSIDARSGMRTSVLRGSAVVQGKGGKVTVSERYSVNLRTAADAYVTEPLASPDTFDKWCLSIDASEDHDLRDPHRAYEPGNVAIMSDNLDNYGEWRTDPAYGKVWHPYHCYAGWRPYHDGHWVWVDPFGWTWVGAEPWGWAPYHYGTWVDESYGWCWVPGPAVQYWSPAVVDFYSAGVNVAWCPLAPAECVYPSVGISIGFGWPNWWLSFGIGACAVWYPGPGGICRPYAWDPRFVNRPWPGGGRFADWGGINHNGFAASGGYVPLNARGAAGASIASASAFGGRGAYRSLPAGTRSAAAFSGGHFVGAPAKGDPPAAGPASARPTAASASATRSISADPPATVSRTALNRSVSHTASPAQSPTAARQTVAQSSAHASSAVAHSNGLAKSTTTHAAPRTSATSGTRSGAAANTEAAHTAAANRARTAANNARSALGLRQSSSSGSNRVASSHHAGTATSGRTTASASNRRTAALTRTRSAHASNNHSISSRPASHSRTAGTSAGRPSFAGSHSRTQSSSITRSQQDRSIGQGSFERQSGSSHRSSVFSGSGIDGRGIGGGHSPGGGGHNGGGRRNDRR